MEVTYKDHLIRLDPEILEEKPEGDRRWAPKFSIYRVGQAGLTFIFGAGPDSRETFGAPEEAIHWGLARARGLVDRSS